MPTFEITGITELNEALSRISDVPQEVKSEILTEMGKTALAAVRHSGQAAGIYDETSQGKHMLDSLALSKPKFTNNGGSITVIFRGTRSDDRHRKTTRQSAVAFYNEYGTKSQRARPFVRPGVEKKRRAIFAAGENVYRRWLKFNF